MSSPIMSPSCGIPIMTEPPTNFFPEDERIDTYAPRLQPEEISIESLKEEDDSGFLMDQQDMCAPMHAPRLSHQQETEMEEEEKEE